MATKKIHDVTIQAGGQQVTMPLATLKLGTIQKWLRSGPTPTHYLVIQSLKQDQDQEKDDGVHRRLKFLVIDSTGRYRETWYNYGPRTRDKDRKAMLGFLGITDESLQSAKVRQAAVDRLVGYVVTGVELNNDTARLIYTPPFLFDPDSQDSDEHEPEPVPKRHSRSQRRANYEYARYEKLEKQRKIEVI
ncbi:hypothetical protein WL32_28335 [Burkholderia cepacia]|uniref:hypothetical protein n=1 Tax=Burkholderia cepacia TaxID=292 RepID=UPI00075452F3|nr:hypothetical protein [Burkholderia cepacia]KWB16522.1 hypothetical protein WL32_28335 [Burkholderia cepacia]